MIAGLKPYPAMKDPGVAWLGRVPEHWKMKRAKFSFREVDDRSISGGEELLSVSHKTGVTPRREKNVTMFLAESNAGHKLCRPGDVVVNTMWAWMAALGVSRYEGLVSPSYGVYRPYRTGDFLSSYLDELLRTPAYRSEYVVRSTGITSSRLRLYPEAFLRVPFLCPPSDEQNAIVRFLSHTDRRVRRYIRAKLKLIKLLEEQKQAIIHRAVTRGLDANVGLKPAGVDWLGDVPEHWEVRRLKTLCNMKSGEGITAMSIDVEGLYPVYGGNGVRGYTSTYTREGDFALIGRQGALCGNVHLAHGRFWASEHAVVVSLRSGYNLDWFGAILVVMNLNQYSIAAAQPGLAVERLLNLWLPVPPPEEQARIARFLRDETADIREAVDRAQREITFLREYRTRLIADVVTGKLDVREAAAALPDEGDEPEALDDTAAGEMDDVVDDAVSDSGAEEDET